MIYKNILDLIGNTPIIKFEDIFIKLEQFNFGCSIKDRVALKMINGLEQENKLKEGSTVIEVTSGNTGIAIAMICAIKRYKSIIIMLDNVSKEKINIIKAYGGNVILTPHNLGLDYSIDVAKKLEKEKGYFFLNQFENINNINAHIDTANEIINDFNKLDYLVCGIGTAGTITGLSRELKKVYQNLKVIGVEPKENAVISNPDAKHSNHGIFGIGAGFYPPLLNSGIVDDVQSVSTEDVYNTYNELSKKGLLLGLSSVASFIVSKKIKQDNPNSIILMISPDNGIKYLSNVTDTNA